MKPSKKSEPQHRRHSDFSASASERWLACPASVVLSRGLESPDSFASLQGTAAHELAAASLLDRVCPTKLRIKGKVPDEFHQYIDDEMRFEIKKYFDRIMLLHDVGEVFIETKFDLSWLNLKKLVHWETIEKGEFAPKGKFTMFGTGDVVCIEPFGDIHVIDLKYGRGKIVEADNNTQLAFYGLGGAAQADWQFSNAHLSIFQPRRDHYPTWSIEKEAVVSIGDLFKAGIEEASKPKPKFKTGLHCGFCPAKEICPARAEGVKGELQKQFSDVPVLTPRALNEAQIARILDTAPLVEDWLTSVRSEAIRRLESDKAIPGYKLVDKKAQRTWKDSAKLSKFLITRGYEDCFSQRELLSPAQVEKVVGKSFVSKWTTQVSSGRTIAKESDRRNARVSKLQSDFED